MSLTKIGSIGINTGIQLAGVTTVTTLHVGSGVTLSSDGDVFATGISTFSEDIKVGSGITLSPDGDGFYTGVVTATTFSGALDASSLTGALPAISGANLTNLDASDLASGTVPTARLGSGTASSSTFLRGDSSFQTITTDLVGDTSPQLGGNLDVNSKTINLGDSSGETVNRIRLGADNDGDLFHDGTDLLLREVDSGQILLRSDGAKVFANSTGSANQAIFRSGGNVELFHDGTKMIETISTGTNIPDGKFAKFGNSNDMSMGHNTYNYITYTGADFLITGDATNQIKLMPKSDEAAIICKPNAEVELFHDGTMQCETSANGLAFPSGKGIDFSATSDASGMTSELFDDYEEGTFEPHFLVAGSESGVSYSSRAATYTKIGRAVTVNIMMELSNNGSNNGQVNIGNLPYTVGDTLASTSHEASGAVGYMVNFGVNVYMLSVSALHSSTQLMLMGQVAHDTEFGHMQRNQTSNTFSFRCSCTYFTA